MEARRRSRRASRRQEPEPPAWEEPALAPDTPQLVSTSQGIADPPERGALASIEDPERRRRQLSRDAPAKPRRHPRHPRDHQRLPAPLQTGPSPAEERLFIRLRAGASGQDAATSALRESPNPGPEDYRHERPIKRVAGEGPTPKRQRRAARPVFDALPLPAPGSERERTPEDTAFFKANGGSPRSPASRSGGPQNGSPKKDHWKIDSPKNGRRNGHPPLDATPTSRSSTEPDFRPDLRRDQPDPATDTKTEPENKRRKAAPEGEIINNDYCTACGGTGEFLVCETCPRSFHFSCVEAPVMDVAELPDGPWSCRHCVPRPLAPDAAARAKQTLFGSLIIAFESQNAMAFQLPTHIRDMFAGVQTSRYGEYLDEYMKTDPGARSERVLDKNGDPLLCFKCHGSALHGRSMAVCSKCREPWHIDCIDPPLESTPFGYWVCPLHVENIQTLPRRVRKPILTPVALKRQVDNDGDIEITDDEDLPGDRTGAGSFSDEEVVKHVAFPHQTRILADGSVAAKNAKHRPRGFELDRVVYKLPARAVKLDFLDAVHQLRSEPYHETPTSSLLNILDTLAETPQPECDAVRNLMELRLQGPAVDTATARHNLSLLVDAALNDANEDEQVAAIRKLMKEKGRDRLLALLKDS